MIDANAILHAQLVRSLGLDRYAEIVNGDPSSPAFRQTFNGYYRVRRNEEWRNYYYTLFCKAKDGGFDYDHIITALFEATGNVEASFSSKMLATIDPGKPIWDQYVLQNLGLELSGESQCDKLRSAISLYEEICHWYDDYLGSKESRENICVFDRLLPDYTWISEVKKIDCLLWCKR